MDLHQTDSEAIRSSLVEPDRFGIVFERYFDDVYGYITRRLGSDAATDVAAEVFYQAFKSRHRFDPSHASARPWLFGIVSHLLRRHYRRETRRLRALSRIQSQPSSLQNHADSAIERVDAAAESGKIVKALSKLSARDRETLLLHAWADLTYREIANGLGVPVGTVRSRLNRARRVLRAALNNPDLRTIGSDAEEVT
jgi:RNA polymerase sigma factor (sigma-70 family)